jgi:hypothetical protein
MARTRITGVGITTSRESTDLQVTTTIRMQDLGKLERLREKEDAR